MSDDWKYYRGAPEENTRVCALQDIPDQNTLCVDLNGFPLLLVRFGDTARAYVNACPHQYMPLNHMGEKIISADKTILRCTFHGAGFSAETGEGVEGHGIGTCLDAVPVNVVNGDVLIGS